MSTQADITETGAQQVTYIAEGVPGGDGLPGQGITGTLVVPGPADGLTVTATGNTFHMVDVVNGAVTLLLPAGTDPGTQVAAARFNSAPGSLVDTVLIQADADSGAALHGGPVLLWGDGQASSFIHAGGDVWWLVGTGDHPDPLTAGTYPGFGVARRDVHGRVQGPDPAADADYATRGGVNGRSGVGLRVNGYVGYSPARTINTSSTLIYGNSLNITADAGSFIPTRDCVAELELDIHLQTSGASAGQFRLDWVTDGGPTASIVNTKRFHFHGDVGTRIFRVDGAAPVRAGTRYWFLLYAGIDPGSTASCVEVDYQYTERS